MLQIGDSLASGIRRALDFFQPLAERDLPEAQAGS
jgi:hypothetical protein